MVRLKIRTAEIEVRKKSNSTENNFVAKIVFSFISVVGLARIFQLRVTGITFL